MCLGSGWVLVREADMPRDNGAEISVMWLQAQEGQGCPQKLEEAGGLSRGAFGGSTALPTPGSQTWSPELIPVV